MTADMSLEQLIIFLTELKLNLNRVGFIVVIKYNTTHRCNIILLLHLSTTLL